MQTIYTQASMPTESQADLFDQLDTLSNLLIDEKERISH